MTEIDQSQIGDLDIASADSSEKPQMVSRLLMLWPVAGAVAILFAFVTYPPLDGTLVAWIGGIPCAISFMLIGIASRPSGMFVRPFVPRTVWLVIGCLSVPILLLANGALDHSPVEQHHQIIVHTILEHDRYGSTYYYVECSSWRGRSHEKLMVSFREYSESHVGDPVIVETHRGAIGIPLLVSVHTSN